MEVTYMGLLEYFQGCIPRAKDRGYILIVSLVARYSDAEKAYRKLEHDWAALNDLTGNNILFLFSTPKVKKRASFLHIPGQPAYVGGMCPFVELLDGKGVEDNRGEFEYVYYDYKKIDWKKKYAQTIGEFAAEYGIPEKDIPCLFIYDLIRDRYMIIPVRHDADIYAMIKNIVVRISEYRKKKMAIDAELERYSDIDRYYTLYRKLDDEAHKDDSAQSIAICKILQNMDLFKSLKNDIADPTVKRNLKRIGQWRRQYFDRFYNDSSDRKKYLELKEAEKNAEKMLNQIWDSMTAEIKVIETCQKKDCEDSIIYDLLAVCVKLQANPMYYLAKENNRNDYIRDMLERSNYEVLDQTRRGLALAGKEAGEVDLLIKIEGMPGTIIEALNLDSLKKEYLSRHIDKIFLYDTVGNTFNIVLVYANVVDLDGFCYRYLQYIKERDYIYQLIKVEDKIKVEDLEYSDIRIMKTFHNRNSSVTTLYHIIVKMGNKPRD